MTAFPAIRPTSRPITPGSWPAVDHRAMGGGVTTILQENVEIGRQVPMTFENITKADWEAIRDHYRGQDGLYEGFHFQSVTLDPARTKAGWWWRHVQAPQCIDSFANVRTVSCLFEMVRQVTPGFGGGTIIIGVNVEPVEQPLPTPPVVVPSFGGGTITVAVEVALASVAPPIRGSVITVPGLSAGVTATGYAALGRRTELFSISTDRAGWFTLYSSSAAAAADVARDRMTMPGGAAGIIADPVFVGAETMILEPKLRAASDDGGTLYPWRFVADSGSGSVTIVITSEAY